MSEENAIEKAQNKISVEVQTVIDHLHNNRTTEREAEAVHRAAERSIRDHTTAKNLGRL